IAETIIFASYRSVRWRTRPARPAGQPLRLPRSRSGISMAKKLTKKQIEHLQQRLLRERDRALRSLGQFDEMARSSADHQQDSDMYSYSDRSEEIGRAHV